MPRVDVGKVVLEYDVHGDLDGEVILPVLGLIDQLDHWPDSICRAMAAEGYATIRFEGRDCGLSTQCDELGMPNLGEVLAATIQGQIPSIPYTLFDLADDAIALLNALGVDRAHLVGYSMGGQVVQCAAIAHPERVKSIALLMSSSRAPTLPSGLGEASDASFDLTLPYDSPDAAIERIARLSRVTQGRAFRESESEIFARASAQFARAHNPAGVARQIAALLGTAPTHDQLARIGAPVTIIHGTDDCFFPIEHAHDLQQRLPHAALEIIEGAGHAITDHMAPEISRMLLAHMQRTIAAVRSAT